MTQETIFDNRIKHSRYDGIGLNTLKEEDEKAWVRAHLELF